MKKAVALIIFVKHMENAVNQDDFMDYDTALSIFRWIAQERYLEQKNAA